MNEAYEAYQLSLNCDFCQGGPLECACEDISMELTMEETLDEALADTGRSFEAVKKLGRAQTVKLLEELSLDARDSASWKTIESMTMWL